MTMREKKKRKPYEGMEPRRMGDPLPLDEYEHKIVDGMKVPIIPPQAYPTPEEKVEIEAGMARDWTRAEKFGDSRLTEEQRKIKERYGYDTKQIKDLGDRAAVIGSDINKLWKNNIGIIYGPDNKWKDSYWQHRITERDPKGKFIMVEYTLMGPPTEENYKMRSTIIQIFTRPGDKTFIPRGDKFDSQGRKVMIVKILQKKSRWD